METIGKISLHQQGAFVAKLQCRYSVDGNTWEHADGSGDILVGQTKAIEPNIPTGSKVSAYIFVVWGSDKTANEIFLFEKGNSRTANYTITGTTLDSSLSFNGIS
jgi:hypothetical protein